MFKRVFGGTRSSGRVQTRAARPESRGATDSEYHKLPPSPDAGVTRRDRVRSRRNQSVEYAHNPKRIELCFGTGARLALSYDALENMAFMPAGSEDSVDTISLFFASKRAVHIEGVHLEDLWDHLVSHKAARIREGQVEEAAPGRPLVTRLRIGTKTKRIQPSGDGARTAPEPAHVKPSRKGPVLRFQR